MKLNRLLGIILIWCSAMMLALYQPFITIWLRNNESMIRHFLTPLLMVIYFYVNRSRMILLPFKDAAGLWKYDRWKPIIAGIANLVMNISFVCCFKDAYKLDGVILSTIIAYAVIQIPWETHVVFTQFFNRQQAKVYWRFRAVNLVHAILFCTLTCFAVYFVSVQGIVGLMLKAVVAFMVSSSLLLIVFYHDILDSINALRKHS